MTEPPGSPPTLALDPISPPGPVAFIGLGQMGTPMAERLIQAGFAVRGVDIAEPARERVTAAGGRGFAGLGAALAGPGACRAIVTMLPDGAAVHAALLADSASRDHLRPGILVIEMSSSAPADTKRLAGDLAARGLRLIDAPVSGGVKRARDGSLAIMAGGAAHDIAAAEPLLLAMGKSVFPTGPVGSAHAMKALNNFVSAAGFAAASEALVVARRCGIDPATVIDVLNASTGRNNSTEVKMKPFVLTETYASGFALGLMSKDLRTASELADQLDVDAPLLRSMADRWAEAARKLGGQADHTEFYRFIAEASKGAPERA